MASKVFEDECKVTYNGGSVVFKGKHRDGQIILSKEEWAEVRDWIDKQIAREAKGKSNA